MDAQGFIRLAGPEGQALLEKVGPLESKTDVVKLVSRLRKDGHDPDLIANVLTQIKLRRKAQAKFGEFADSMFFTQEGLEQASRLSVAAMHANRFRLAGVKEVADLGCGIGAESLALASLDINVRAFDSDEITAAIATYNLASFPNAKVEQADVTTLNLNQFEALFLDPARRDTHARKFDPNSFSPNLDFVLSAAQTKPSIVKLGPGLDHDLIPEQAEAVWVSVNGDLVELSLYFGKVKRPNVLRAALLITEHGYHEIVSDKIQRTDAEVGSIAEYIYEPDSAIIRSHLLGDLAAQLGLHIFSPEIAYLTAGNKVHSPWLKTYRLIQNLPFDRKKLKAYLTSQNIGPLEIKKRGSDITPEDLRKELNLKGKLPATLIITRVGEQHRALVVEPLPDS